MEEIHYRTFVNDSKYSSWRFINIKTEETVEFPDIIPHNEKLFNNDIFSYDSKNNR